MRIMIPSRLGSTRIPEKALSLIKGKPMIRCVVERALLTNLPVSVCTDSEKIRDCVADLVTVVMTSKDLPNGTARIAAACKDYPPSEKVIDVQGDDPLVDPETILDIAEKMKGYKEGCFVPYSISLDPITDAQKKSVVKIFSDEKNSRAIFMSRHQSYHPEIGVKKHSSVIGFFNSTLQLFSSLPKTPMEVSESIELMRLIENGYPCHTWEMKGVPGISVDTPQDLLSANQL